MLVSTSERSTSARAFMKLLSRGVRRAAQMKARPHPGEGPGSKRLPIEVRFGGRLRDGHFGGEESHEDAGCVLDLLRSLRELDLAISVNPLDGQQTHRRSLLGL